MSSYKLFYFSKYKNVSVTNKKLAEDKKFKNSSLATGKNQTILYYSIPLSLLFLSINFYINPLFTKNNSTEFILPQLEVYSDLDKSKNIEKKNQIIDIEEPNKIFRLEEIDDWHAQEETVVNNNWNLTKYDKHDDVVLSDKRDAHKKKNPRKEIKYIIQPNDTLWKIAKKHNLHIDSIMSRNDISPLSTLNIGKSIIVPSKDGLYIKIKKNNSFASISREYNIPISVIQKNNPNFDILISGKIIFIEGARFPLSKRKLLLGSFFRNPTEGVKTSGYGYRIHPIKKVRMFHAGVDIGANAGKMVRSAASGKVTFAGKKGAYGNCVIIKHKHGYSTTYAHLKNIRCKKGQQIKTGEKIGTVGSTGLSTGPHLHFEIKQNGRYINPERFIQIKKHSHK